MANTDPEFGAAVRAALCLSTCDVDFWRVVSRQDGEGDAPACGAPRLMAWQGLLIRYGIVAAVLIGCCLYVRHLQSAARDAQAAVVLAESDATAARASIAVLREAARDKATAAHQREIDYRRIRQQFDAYRAAREQARAADPAYAAWAATPHPDAVGRRLRAAPAATAAAGSDPDLPVGAPDGARDHP